MPGSLQNEWEFPCLVGVRIPRDKSRGHSGDYTDYQDSHGLETGQAAAFAWTPGEWVWVLSHILVGGNG
jgi:hypothetical protein